MISRSRKILASFVMPESCLILKQRSDMIIPSNLHDLEGNLQDNARMLQESSVIFYKTLG